METIASLCEESWAGSLFFHDLLSQQQSRQTVSVVKTNNVPATDSDSDLDVNTILHGTFAFLMEWEKGYIIAALHMGWSFKE